MAVGIKTIRASQLVAWVVLAVHLLAGPVASFGHRHSDGTGCCGSPNPAAAPVAGNVRTVHTASKTQAASERCCRFRSCRAARHAAVAKGHDREPTAGGHFVSAPCSACEFLTQLVAVANWSLHEHRCGGVRPAAEVPVQIWCAPVASGFLARGPPAIS